VNGLLRDAAKKAPNGPYAVFVDVNLPSCGMGPTLDAPWCQECFETFAACGKTSNGAREPFNLGVFTTNPHHFVEDQIEFPPRRWFISWGQSPQHALANRDEIVKDLLNALKTYDTIPDDFPEASTMLVC
ncbi:MAG TPA: hypothetical protein VL992_03620, partial [Tepidisphaeraceae bacterium]|nr:hypothetical protein [Tepidisphaeraceae bacterium]